MGARRDDIGTSWIEASSSSESMNSVAARGDAVDAVEGEEGACFLAKGGVSGNRRGVGRDNGGGAFTDFVAFAAGGKSSGFGGVGSPKRHPSCPCCL